VFVKAAMCRRGLTTQAVSLERRDGGEILRRGAEQKDAAEREHGITSGDSAIAAAIVDELRRCATLSRNSWL
jgi:hypothetical protein